MNELRVSSEKEKQDLEHEDLALELVKVSFSWNTGTKALDQCNLVIPRPGLWMIVGCNGSGKSTLFRLISGMIKPQKGEIQCSYKTALMFQNPDHQLLLPSCGSDLMLSAPQDQPREELRERINSALQQVGLAGMAPRPIHTLSGGQKQRLALASALVSNSNLLLLDEPTALLDPLSQKSILELVKSLSRRAKNPISALWITHLIQELAYCDGAAMMKNGRIGNWQPGHELMNNLKMTCSNA